MVWVEVEARLVLAAVFAVSATGKLRSKAAFTAFEAAVARLGRVPRRLVRPVGALLAAGEAALAAAVLVTVTARAAVALMALLLIAFTFVLARAVRARDEVVCNCFGPSRRPVGAAQLVRNALLIALAAAALAGWPDRTTGPADVAVAPLLVCLLGAVVLAGVVALWDDLADLFTPAPRPGARRVS